MLQGGELRPLSVLSLLSHMAYEITSFYVIFFKNNHKYIIRGGDAGKMNTVFALQGLVS